MSKLIDSEARQANNVGKFIKAKDLLDAPIQLYMQELKEEQSKFKNDNGDYPMQNVFYCEDVEGKEKIITVGMGSSLFRALDELDPDTRDLLEIWTVMEDGNDYPQWRARIVGKTVSDEKNNEKISEAEKAGKKVLADKRKKEMEEKDDDEITIDDLPF